MLVEQLVEHGAVLKARVHALAVEGHNGVGGVAEQQHVVVVLPRKAADGDERTGGVLKNSSVKSGIRGTASGNTRPKNSRDLGRGLQRGKALRPLVGKKQRGS